MNDTYNTPSTAEVLQQDEDLIIPTIPIPVDVRNPIRVDDMPTRSYFRNFVLTDAMPELQICGEDARRKSVTVWFNALGSGFECLCIGSNRGDVSAGHGAMMFNNFTIMTLKLETRSELWVRGFILTDVTGTWQGWNPVTTDGAIVNAAFEQWAQ